MKNGQSLLDHPAYQERIKLRGYNCRVNVLMATNDTDGGRVLKRLNPSWTKGDHKALAEQHAQLGKQMHNEWNALLDVAALQAFGRKYHITDYRISGIACEEFSDEHKDRLRYLAHASTHHRAVARAHASAARWMRNA